MSAGVVEGAQLVVGSCDDNALRTYVCNEVVAVFVQYLGATHANPVPVPDRLEFALVVVRIEVPVAGQAWLCFGQSPHTVYFDAELSKEQA